MNDASATPASFSASSRVADPPLLECRGLGVGYGARAILPEISLSIGAGEFWSVIGRNGAGKTTWMRTLLGLVPPLSGTLDLRSELRLAYVPQRSLFDELYPVRVRDVVAMGQLRGRSFLRRPSSASAQRVHSALSAMGVAELASEPFGRLSEGQKQRALLARLAVSEAHLAFLDEPTSAMDPVAERDAFRALDSLRQRQGLSIVIVTHYLGLAREFADHALFVDRDAELVIAGSRDEVFDDPRFRDRYAPEAG